ncbi:phage portal protein [Alkalihalobacillus sp. 1P02AB]|uniref:phage portal protein n=1 Tax=Alkalihalobacillus sp. 1P02AB TaxID=3132260 RepID=UPI0039A72D4B
MKKNDRLWFKDYVNDYSNKAKKRRIIDWNSYLSGNHKILNEPNEMFNGKELEVKRTIINIPKTINLFHKTYLLENNLQITGEEEIASDYNKVYERGDFHSSNFKLLDTFINHGEVYEFVYSDKKGIIRSHLFKPQYSYPVYNHKNEMESFVYHYTYGKVDYYEVYYSDFVETYSTVGNDLLLTSRKPNASGMLPIPYLREVDTEDGIIKPDIEFYKSSIDDLEYLIAKTHDAVYKFITGTLLIRGQMLTLPEGIKNRLAGFALNVDDNGDAEYIRNDVLVEAAKFLKQTYIEDILNTSETPAIALNQTSIDNISEESIRHFYKIADNKASEHKRYLRNGFNLRHRAIRKLLELQGTSYSDDEFHSLKTNFQTLRPNNHKEQIEVMKLYREEGAMSSKTILEYNPYVTDSKVELERIKQEQEEEKASQGKDETVSDPMNSETYIIEETGQESVKV